MVVIILHARPYILETLDGLRMFLLLHTPDQPFPHQQRARRRLDIDLVTGPYEIKQPQSVLAVLVRRRPDDTVHGRFEVSGGPETQRVANIADDPSIHRFDISPIPTLLGRRLDLQSRDVLRPQERQGAEVRVASGPGLGDLVVLGVRARVVGHVPEVVFGFGGVEVAGGEVVGRQLEDEGEEDEDFVGDGEGAAGEFLDFRGEAFEEGAAGFVVEFGDVFGDVDL